MRIFCYGGGDYDDSRDTGGSRADGYPPGTDNDSSDDD